MPPLTHSIERESAYFDDSRRLTGPNLFFARTGALLEALGPASKDAAAHARWRTHVQALASALGWGNVETVARAHAASTSLALSAPLDQLFTATEVNEWAWETATAEAYPECNISNAVSADGVEIVNNIGDFTASLARLRARSENERNVDLTSVMAMADAHGLRCCADDNVVSIGSGAGCHAMSMNEVENLKRLDWCGVSDIPVALVTGSNGKTTTTRLIAAIATAHGWTPGICSTEGVVIGGAQVTTGDYSGPVGARTVLRDRRVQCAVLESARGGILRRGLAVTHANVAVVTNVSADHFGEYGIDNLDDLADAKLIVARALAADGILVLNAEDPILMKRSSHLWLKSAVFSSVWQNDHLQTKRAQGGMTCGVNAGRLLISRGESVHDLGEMTKMPLTVQGAATYNIANIAAAALAAYLLGIAPETIATVLQRFGQARADNPGRLERWQQQGVEIIIDYAHNPAGLAGLLGIASSLKKAGGRMGLLLGQAGNREDGDIAELARRAAAYQPDMVVLKDISGFARGRASGEVAALLHHAMIAAGIDAARINIKLDEFAASKLLVAWSRAGDVIVLPMHGTLARQAMRDWLDARDNE